MGSFESAKEQWHFKTRQELTTKLRNEIFSFIEERHMSEEHRALFYLDEIEIEYECLYKQYLVGDYFVTPLLKFSKEMQPELSTKIIKPEVFWAELVSRFMTSFDMVEQRKIVMTMCLIYK